MKEKPPHKQKQFIGLDVYFHMFVLINKYTCFLVHKMKRANYSLFFLVYRSEQSFFRFSKHTCHEGIVMEVKSYDDLFNKWNPIIDVCFPTKTNTIVSLNKFFSVKIKSTIWILHPQIPSPNAWVFFLSLDRFPRWWICRKNHRMKFLWSILFPMNINTNIQH